VHHLLVQPDVHGGGIAGIPGVVQFLRQFLAGLQAGIDVQQLKQVDDRGAPVQRLPGLGGFGIENGLDIDLGAVGSGALLAAGAPGCGVAGAPEAGDGAASWCDDGKILWKILLRMPMVCLAFQFA
jgi:hypothetical protein